MVLTEGESLSCGPSLSEVTILVKQRHGYRCNNVTCALSVCVGAYPMRLVVVSINFICLYTALSE